MTDPLEEMPREEREKLIQKLTPFVRLYADLIHIRQKRNEPNPNIPSSNG